MRSWRAGAGMVHIHVRDPQSGKPAFEKELFAEAVERIRAESDVLINLTTHALLLGGHIRVGFEDNLYLSRGVKADSNARFVERAVALAKLLDREVASCAEARQILGLSPWAPSPPRGRGLG